MYNDITLNYTLSTMVPTAQFGHDNNVVCISLSYRCCDNTFTRSTDHLKATSYATIFNDDSRGNLQRPNAHSNLCSGSFRQTSRLKQNTVALSMHFALVLTTVKQLQSINGEKHCLNNNQRYWSILAIFKVNASEVVRQQ